jgi:hypothetical protein
LKSITDQIDEVLQSKLVGGPHEKRGIRVRSGPNGAALFEADGRAYESVDELPDAEIREMIRSAVAEWEQHK